MKWNKPTLGNSTQNILANMPKELGEEQEVAYRISGWVQIDNGWDSMENKPMEMTRDQQAQVDEVVSLMEKYNIQVSVQVQRKQGMEIKDYPVVARWRLFTNKPSAPAGNYTVAETRQENTPESNGANWGDI